MAALVDCDDISAVESLRRYLTGLRKETRDYVHPPKPLNLVIGMKHAEAYDGIKFRGNSCQQKQPMNKIQR